MAQWERSARFKHTCDHWCHHETTDHILPSIQKVPSATVSRLSIGYGKRGEKSFLCQAYCRLDVILHLLDGKLLIRHVAPVSDWILDGISHFYENRRMEFCHCYVFLYVHNCRFQCFVDASLFISGGFIAFTTIGYGTNVYPVENQI